MDDARAIAECFILLWLAARQQDKDLDWVRRRLHQLLADEPGDGAGWRGQVQFLPETRGYLYWLVALTPHESLLLRVVRTRSRTLSAWSYAVIDRRSLCE
jgi:hypothetical protein